MGEISRAQDAVFAAMPPRFTITDSEHENVLRALEGLYQVGYRHGEVDYESKHEDDEPLWLSGARALVQHTKDDRLLGQYVRAFLDG